MKMKMHLHFLGLLCLLINLGSCAVYKTSASAIDLEEPKDGQALIYVIRPSIAASFLKSKLYGNGQYLGTTKSRRYIYAHVPAGNYLLEGKLENTAELRVSIEAGETCFIEQEIKGGVITARNKLVRIEENKARELLSKCKASDLMLQ